MDVRYTTTTGREPHHATDGASGYDLRANLVARITIAPQETVVIPTGVAIAMPYGVEAQVRPRSGLAAKHGVTVLNAPGTIDSDYIGEIKVLLINCGKRYYTINDGDRIAQLVFAHVVHPDFVRVGQLGSTARGTSGFGGTGK